MKIEGVIRVEGVELHVDVEAPDGASHLYVTNVSPDCLIIPPERLALGTLGFSEDALVALTAQQCRTLADLVDTRGNVRPLDLTPAVREEVDRILQELRNAALVFDWKLQPAAVRDITTVGDVPLTMEGMPAMGRARSSAHYGPEEILNRHIGEIEVLRQPHRNALVAKGVTTVRELIALGEEGLLMTRSFDLKKIEQVKGWLTAKGVSLDGKLPSDHPPEAEPAPASDVRQFLLSQGLGPGSPEEMT